MRKIINLLFRLIIILCFQCKLYSSIITTLNKTDPQPLYASTYPYAYLYTNVKENLKNRGEYGNPEIMSFSVSAFFQSAKRGKNLDQRKAELGDLTGRWNMIAALPFTTIHRDNVFTQSGNDLPAGYAFPEQLTRIAEDLLECTSTVTFPQRGFDAIPDELKSIQGLLTLQPPLDQFGFFSVPIKYRKKGVRFQAQGRIFRDLGIAVQLGVSDISQTALFVDLTTTGTGCLTTTCIMSCPTNTRTQVGCLNPFSTDKVTDADWTEIVNCVHREVMNKLKKMAQATGINLCNFNKTSIEDLHAELFWRHAFCVDKDTNLFCSVPFLFIPFASLGVDLGFGREADPDQILSVPFGNNGHNAIRFNAGFSLDFVDTVEIGGHAGFTHFFSKTFDDYRVPNNIYQNAFYPFKTGVCIEPGNTWHIGLFMNAYHFLDCLSAYVEYVWMTHNEDKIHLLRPDSAFKPEQLECKSPWSVQVVNGGLNYDVSPNFLLGYAIQIPVQRRNAYRATTHIVTLEMRF